MSDPASPSIRRNAVWALLAEGFRAVAAAALTLYITRALDPDGYGLYALAIGIGSLALLPSDFGITPAASRFIAERRGNRGGMAAVLGDALRLKLLFAGVVSVAVALLAGEIADAYGEPGLEAPLRWTALALFAQSFFQLLASVFVAMGRASFQLWLFVAENLAEVTLVGGIVLLGGGAAGAAAGRAGAYVIATALGLVFAARLLSRRWARDEGPSERTPGPGRRLATYAGALFIVDSAFALFANIDVLLIGAYLDSSDVGLFEAALRLTTFLALPGIAIASAVAPRVARHASQPQAVGALVGALRGLIVLGMAAAVLVAVWADPIVNLLLGDEYAESADVLRAFAPYVLLSILGPLVTLSVNYLGQAARRIPIVIVSLAVNTILDIILIPRIGIVAGAIATGVAYGIYLPAHLYFLHRMLPFDIGALARTFGRALLAGAALAGVLAAAGTSSLSAVEWIAGGALGLLAFAGVLLLTREVSIAQLRALPRELRR